MKLCRAKSGQAVVEYVLVFLALLGVYFALRSFTSAARSSAARTTELVTCDYP